MARSGYRTCEPSVNAGTWLALKGYSLSANRSKHSRFSRKKKSYANPKFPLRFDIDAPVGRTYFYRVWLDVDPNDGSSPNKKLDPMANPGASPSSPVPSSGSAKAVTLDLVDPPYCW